jgi:hypothetical protein
MRADRVSTAAQCVQVLAALIRMGASATEDEATRMIRAADVDGNGEIDIDEFIEYMRTLPPPVEGDGASGGGGTAGAPQTGVLGWLKHTARRASGLITADLSGLRAPDGSAPIMGKNGSFHRLLTSEDVAEFRVVFEARGFESCAVLVA